MCLSQCKHRCSGAPVFVERMEVILLVRTEDAALFLSGRYSVGPLALKLHAAGIQSDNSSSENSCLLSATSYESQELPLISFVNLRKRLVVASVEDRAVLEEILGKHQFPGRLARLPAHPWLLFPACR